MKSYVEILKQHIEQNPSDLGDADSVLEMLYDCHNERNPYDDDRIKADFQSLYQVMNGMNLREMDQILDPVCTLCRDHERAGFAAGVRIGFALAGEVTDEFPK
ncbi:MAG: hypothetical protein IJZ38_12750 [Bacteroides sp.]|nr:hypothetical protein [Bacteroides sp.]